MDATPLSPPEAQAPQLITFGQLTGLPQAEQNARLAMYESAIWAYIGESIEDSPALVSYRLTHADKLKQREVGLRVGQSLLQAPAQLPVDFWTQPWSIGTQSGSRLSHLVSARSRYMAYDASLQMAEKQLNRASYSLLERVLTQPYEKLKAERQIQVSNLTFGTPQHWYLLSGVTLIASAQAFTDPQSRDPALLYCPGALGGIRAFDSLTQLQASVFFTLRSQPDSVLWERIAPQLRAPAQALVQTQSKPAMIFRPVEGGLFAASVQAQIDSYAQSVQLVHQGVTLYVDLQTQAQTLERLRLETVEGLLCPLDEARSQGIERVSRQRCLAAAAARMPDWLLQCAAPLQAQYARQLKAYAEATALVEEQLLLRLPTLETFTRDKLVAQLNTDLTPGIDPDRVTVERPDAVTTEKKRALIDQQFIFVVEERESTARSNVSLTRLALENLDPGDEHEMLRLKYARLRYGDRPAASVGITHDYLKAMIPALDIGRYYEQRIVAVFNGQRGPTGTVDQASYRSMVQAWQLAIELQVTAAKCRGQLTQSAQQMLAISSRARTRQQLQQEGYALELRQLSLRSGTSRTGEYREEGLVGGVALVDNTSGRAVLYLPDAPDEQVFFEGPTLDLARLKLVDQAIASPAFVRYLASHVAGGNDIELWQSHINLSLAEGWKDGRGFGFISVSSAPSVHVSMAELGLKARMGELIVQARKTTRSGLDIEHARMERDSDYWQGYVKLALSFAPGIGVLVSAYDGWHSLEDAARAVTRGQQAESAQQGFFAAWGLAEVILGLAPGAALLKSGSKAAGLARIGRSVSKGIRNQVGRFFSASAPVTRISPAFEGYALKIRLYDALPQTGLNAYTYKLADQLYIRQDGQVYAVTRRQGEQTLRLMAKKPEKTYEPPIRQNARGRWEYHSDVGLKGGGKEPVLTGFQAMTVEQDDLQRMFFLRPLRTGGAYAVNSVKELKVFDFPIPDLLYRAHPGDAPATIATTGLRRAAGAAAVGDDYLAAIIMHSARSGGSEGRVMSLSASISTARRFSRSGSVPVFRIQSSAQRGGFRTMADIIMQDGARLVRQQKLTQKSLWDAIENIPGYAESEVFYVLGDIPGAMVSVA